MDRIGFFTWYNVDHHKIDLLLTSKFEFDGTLNISKVFNDE
jgi:hypothetical protein